MKQLQNRIAESGLTLPVAAVTGLLVWLLSGLVSLSLWPQLACFVATVYLLVELSNQNALLRVRSRMVSSTFIVLSCTACFLFSSLTGAVVQLCMVAVLLLLFTTYQDPQAVGRTYYAFLCLGVGTTVFMPLMWYLPLLWVLMATQLQSLGWRTWLASLLGIITPYWFLLLWFIYQQDFTPLLAHLSRVADIQMPHFTLQAGNVTVYVFTLVMVAVGIVHFWKYSFEDKIRIRLLYGFFTTIVIFTLLLAMLQPQHFGVMMRLAFLFASPLIAHVFTFTGSRLSNILFFVAIGLAVAITVFNLVIYRLA